MSARAISPSSFGLDVPVTKPRSRTKTVSKKASTTKKTASRAIVAKKVKAPDLVRTSTLLRDLLVKNPDFESFTIEQIATAIGTGSFGTSLMFFSIPEAIPIPIPGISALMVMPTALIATQMTTGKKHIKLPKFLLERAVPRKALAAAIHAILPVLERAEKVTKPRWKWASSAAGQRVLGLFIFLLALSIALPIPGFNMPQAIAIFTIGLGMVEKDGVVICLGVLMGLASLLLLGGVVVGLLSLFGLGGV